MGAVPRVELDKEAKQRGKLIIFEYSNILMLMADALRQFKAEFFQALAHPTRIAIIEILRDGELSAGSIIEELNLEQANASQHFSVLRSRNVLVSRRTGNQVFYSVRYPIIIEVLDVMRRFFQIHMGEVQATLKAVNKGARHK